MRATGEIGPVPEHGLDHAASGAFHQFKAGNST
jgi:hypothetical protein